MFHIMKSSSPWTFCVKWTVDHNEWTKSFMEFLFAQGNDFLTSKSVISTGIFQEWDCYLSKN